MAVAIITTKVPLLIEDGFWKMAHESRTDYAVALGLVYLLLEGAGSFSIDHKLAKGRG